MKNLLLVLVLLSRCPAGHAAPDYEAASCLMGHVRTLGTSPTPFIVIETDSARVELTGDSVPRIRQLVGALVTVCGRDQAAGRLVVESFELKEVDGMQAYLGTVRQTGQLVTLDRSIGGQNMVLSDAPDRLRALLGREVWVAGVWIGATFSVRSFGLMNLRSDA